MKFAFVILHYLVTEDTIDCVNSILQNLEGTNYEIVIVENGSNNGSGNILKEIYSTQKIVHIIELNNNYGFAKGNNFGFQFAKGTLNANYIIMINNDTIIKQKNFLQEVERIYKRNKFDILGPDIISLIDLKHQNPYSTNTVSYTQDNVEKLIQIRRINLFMSKIYIRQIAEYVYLNFFKPFFPKKMNNLELKNNSSNHETELVGRKLHGSCLIFSPDFIKKYNGLYSKTYMYMEEEILFYIAKQEKLNTLYSPRIQIFHKEDSSTNALVKSDRKKKIFIYKNEILSLKQLLSIIRDNNIYRQDMLSEHE